MTILEPSRNGCAAASWSLSPARCACSGRCAGGRSKEKGWEMDGSNGSAKSTVRLLPDAQAPAQVVSVAGVWGCILTLAAWLGAAGLLLLVKLLWG